VHYIGYHKTLNQLLHTVHCQSLYPILCMPTQKTKLIPVITFISKQI